MIQQILFLLVTVIAFGYAYKQYARIWQNVKLGQAVELKGDKSQRWRNVVLIALGQKKMFKKWIPGLFHFFIYAAFIITQIELIEIFVDGIFGTHRPFASLLGGFYTFVISLIEILSVLAFVATLIFLSRRNLLKIPRFHKPEMKGWPQLDGNIILYLELSLVIGIMMMNGADTVLQSMGAEHYHPTGSFAVSSWLGPALFGGLSEGALVIVERLGWWLHFLVVLAFLNYLPISKHLHVFLAFPNVFFAKLTQKGEIPNMDDVTQEVKIMLGLIEPDPGADLSELPEFGSKDVFDLTQVNLLNAYTCTECGRCTQACPANITGKKLSPRKIMMDVRDRMEEVGKNIRENKTDCIAETKKADGAILSKDNYDDGKSLFDLISDEELFACTTCNACVEACPVLINPLDIIIQMRRYKQLTLSEGPADWLPMFNAIENSGSVWQLSTERDAWKNDL